MALTFLVMLAVARAISSSVSTTGKEMICSKENAIDCYPRIFEPTENFAQIREGQDLPPGLHVRMDIYSGTKEARLNIPMKGEESPSIEVPIERAMVVVDQPEAEEIEPNKPAMRDQVPIKAPVFETAGKIVPPPPSGDDFSNFQKAMNNLNNEGEGYDAALDDLKDLSHDIYYGLEIVKDEHVLEELVCLILGSASAKHPARENGRDHKAASILASALQNNPTALKKVGDFKQLVLYPKCGPDSKTAQGDFVSVLQRSLGEETDAQALKSKVAAISGLLKEEHIRDEFLQQGVLELLLAIFLKEGSGFDVVRKRVVQLVTDTFLDEEMGAELGIWPKSAAFPITLCRREEVKLDGGCWEYHVEAFGKKDTAQTWSEEFLVMLKAQRAKIGDSTKEL